MALNRPAFWRLANALKEFMNLLLQAKRESDPRLQIMIFRRATLLGQGMKTPIQTCSNVHWGKKMRTS